jgi:hypothetical protein
MNEMISILGIGTGYDCQLERNVLPRFRLAVLELVHNGADNVIVDGVNVGEGVRVQKCNSSEFSSEFFCVIMGNES